MVDADGTVVDVVPRADMRARNLRHRSVAVVVRRPGDGEVLVHRRAAWKDVWPSYWDLAFGGVCAVGEGWVDAAVRELAEEAGVDVAAAELRPLGRASFTDARVDVVAEAFEVRHGGPFTFADGEVTEATWITFDDLAPWAAERDVCPDSLQLARTLLLRSSTVRPQSPTGEEEPR